MRGADLKSLPAGQIFYQGTDRAADVNASNDIPMLPPMYMCCGLHVVAWQCLCKSRICDLSTVVHSSKQSFLMGICYCTSAILFLWFCWAYHHRNNSPTFLYNFFSEKYLKLLYKKERVGTQASRPGEELSAPSTSHRLQIVVLFFIYIGLYISMIKF
jgi:hypothetical protein